MSLENNKRIAKNTMYLYVRMLVVMVVSLFTVRIVLDALGAEDYGINNVVGGIVTMFSFLTSTMNAASMRFFSYYLGKKDFEKLSEYFSMSFWCFVGMAVIVIIIAQTIGLWFVQNKLVIPNERMSAAMWVYQCSIFTFLFRIVSIPYNAIIIAHERMNVYALGGLLEVFLKLGAAYLLYISPVDKLITYAVLWGLMMCAIDVFYIVYGLRSFSESRVRRFCNKSILIEVVSYSGWNLFGAISGVVRSQGINILLNMFFNPVVNAARAIAFQVNNAINNFVLNFYKAVQPQITKYYAADEQDNMLMLVFRSSRLCYYLILFLSLPLLIETPFILSLWLKEVPENAVLFTRLVVLTAIIDSTSYPLQTSISATGRIKYFQIVTGGLLVMNLPVAWIFLKMGYAPQVTMYIAMAISAIAQVTRVFFAKKYTNMSVRKYLREVICPILIVTIVSIVMPILVWTQFDENLTRFFVVGVVCVVSTSVSVIYLGITKRERSLLNSVIKKRIRWRK